MPLFTGQAWFSPRVPTSVRKAWGKCLLTRRNNFSNDHTQAAHGGTDAGSHGDRLQATYLFCDGNDDPWFPKLHRRSMAVFHWLWVTAVVNARFRVSISAYAIDEHTILDLSECPAPAYSHGPSRQIEGARVQQVANDCGGQSDTSVASHAHISRKTVRVIDDTNADSEADWNASADSSYRKRKSVPFVDLRAVTEKRKASTKKRSRRMKVAPCASGKPSNRVVSPRTHENLQMPTGVLVSVPAPRPSQALSVAAALESLSYVSVQRTTQFIPGAIYEGKEFRCFYVR